MSFSDLKNIDLKKFLLDCFSNKIQSLEPLTGDAGLREYYRLYSGNKNYIVMDSSQDCSTVQPFIDIAIYLKKLGFSAPEIIHRNTKQGFLVLEDFGSVTIKNYLQNHISNDPKKHDQLYYLIIDLLITLQEQTAPNNLPILDNKTLCMELDLFVDWYIPYKHGRCLKDSEYQEFTEIWETILAKQIPMDETIILRDYHVENMMYLQNRKSTNQLGLLDFQDALVGSPIYDLVSVLKDARYTVSQEQSLKYIKYFAQKKNLPLEDILCNYHILGTQRNSRILGVFTRKAKKHNDNQYLRYIPRVLKYLEYNLSHPKLSVLQKWLKELH